MVFKDLTQEDKDYILTLYDTNRPRLEIQEEISKKYGISVRWVREWAKKLCVGMNKENTILANSSKVLIYDIETSRVNASLWWTGKQYVRHNQLTNEPKIISIAYKWLGKNKVYHLDWGESKDDKELIKDFLKVYNDADMVIGQNNNSFDNKWVNARAFKHGLEINTYIKSFDIMREAKRLFRLPSYSMDYITKFLGITNKGSHDGILMWEKIENGTKKEQKKYLKKMIQYNIQDVLCTEEMYLKIRKYSGHIMHFGVLNGEESYSCPNCGSYMNLELKKTTTTVAGTINRVMRCKADKVKFKISNKKYMDYLKAVMKREQEINNSTPIMYS